MRSIIRALALVIVFFWGVMVSALLHAAPPPGKDVGVVGAKTYLWVQKVLGYAAACEKVGCTRPKIRLLTNAEMDANAPKMPGHRTLAYFDRNYPTVVFVSEKVLSQLRNKIDLQTRDKGMSTLIHESVHQIQYSLGLMDMHNINAECFRARIEYDAYLVERLYQKISKTEDTSLRDVWAKSILPSCLKTN